MKKLWQISNGEIKVKICDIDSVEKAYSASVLGADALGYHIFKGQEIEDRIKKISEIIRYVPKNTSNVLLIDLSEPEEILNVLNKVSFDTVQIYPKMGHIKLKRLKNGLDNLEKGIKILTAISATETDVMDDVDLYSEISDGLLIDSSHDGGTGKTHDWLISKKIVEDSTIPVILAGGLNPENVKKAIKTVSPYGVDVETGVCDIVGGRKIMNVCKMKEFIERAKSK